MPALFVYLLKVNVALLVLGLGYFLVLRRLTFYTLNRAYLIFAILFSSLYPRIDLSSFLVKHHELARPARVLAIRWPVASLNAGPRAATGTSGTVDEPSYHYWHYLEVLFWIGVVLLFLRLVFRLVSLVRLHQAAPWVMVQSYKVKVLSINQGPFSFWQCIYLNPAGYAPDELDTILAHEQVHVSQWHTLDILLAELSTIFYWFNPGVWLLKKAVRENIEFITDRKVLEQGIDSKTYQYSLLRINYQDQHSFVSHFSMSTLKKRIMMMNAKRSSAISLSSYALLMPLAATLLLGFSVSRAARSGKASLIHGALTKVLDSPVSHGAVVESTPSVSGEGAGAAKTVKNRFVSVRPAAASASRLDTDTTEAVALHPMIKLDTTVNGLHISSAGMKKSADSVIYVVNGVLDVSGTNVLRRIKPDQIATINIYHNYSNDSFKTLPGQSIMFIVTKGNENTPAVLALNRSMAKLKRHLSITGMTSTTDSRDNAATVPLRGGSSVKPFQSENIGRLKVVPGYTVTAFSSTGPVRGTAITKSLTSTKGKGHYTVQAFDNYNNSRDTAIKALTLTKEKNGIHLDDNEGIQIYSDSVTVKMGKVSGMSASGFYVNKTAGRVWKNSFQSPSSISNFSDKLILVNGKPASAAELKKISANDIKSVDLVEGPQTKAKYGPKAAHGVVRIKTKN